MAKPRNVKQAMEDGNYRVKNIYAKYSNEIRVDFEILFPQSGNSHCSFWTNRDYFKRNYPETYNRF